MARPPQLIRLTVSAAAVEFGLDRNTLTKRLKRADVEPGTDGRYSIQQIVSALYDDASSERTRLYREQADKLALENAKSRMETIDVETVYKAYEGVFIAIRQTILASNLNDIEKSEILGNLRHDTTEARPAE
jgi:phage terminase Nu1 subunit (DNA packaging protein)